MDYVLFLTKENNDKVTNRYLINVQTKMNSLSLFEATYFVVDLQNK